MQPPQPLSAAIAGTAVVSAAIGKYGRGNYEGVTPYYSKRVLHPTTLRVCASSRDVRVVGEGVRVVGEGV